MGKKSKASILTLEVSIINSLVSVLFSLIYNNFLIRIYGTQVNGLISTLTQFVSLFSIIEGGFTTAAVVATYSPIVNKDYKLLNNILYTTKRTYLKIGTIITWLVITIGSIYINFIDSPFSRFDTFFLLILSALVSVSSLCFLSKYTVLLQGDNKEYVQVCITLIARVITWSLSIYLMLTRTNIIVVYSINIINILLNVFLLAWYEKRKYPFVTYKGEFNKDLIKGTKDVLFQKIANAVFTSTDLILISSCISLALASVYNVYYQVFKSVLTLLSSVAQAPFNSFGHLVKEGNNNEKLKKYFDIYQHLVLVATTILLTVTGVLIIPFIKIYTSKITDYSYVYPSLALLFFSQIFLQSINRPYGTILNATGNFKMQNTQCAIAAVGNIILSISFIPLWGLNSIIFGSIAGTLIILVMNIWHVYMNVLHQSARRTCRNILCNYSAAIILISLTLHFGLPAKNYFELFFLAICVSMASALIIVLFNLIIDKYSTVMTITYIKERIVICDKNNNE